MKHLTINLSDVSTQYRQFRYPAGEWQVRFDKPVSADEVTVIARIGGFDDIGKLALLKNAIGHRTYSRLILPYLPYSRADRAFTPGDCCALEVFGEMLGPMRFDEVVTLDAHNVRAARLYIANLIDRPADLIIQQAIVDFAERHEAARITVLFPDDGARKRYVMPPMITSNQKVIELDIRNCSKDRDEKTGTLKGFDVPEMPNQPAIIVDDICDGGGTFLGIASRITGIRHQLGLYVTHGIFSKGYDALLGAFNAIYTTDTIDQTRPLAIRSFSAMPTLLRAG